MSANQPTNSQGDDRPCWPIWPTDDFYNVSNDESRFGQGLSSATLPLWSTSSGWSQAASILVVYSLTLYFSCTGQIGRVGDLGEQYRVPSTTSSYLQRVNSSLVRAALAAAKRERGEVYSALILRNVGEFVNAGEDLAQILGSSSSQAADRLASTVRSSCDIGAKQPQLVAPVRVNMMLETVLVRRQIVVVVPIKKEGAGSTQVFVLRSPGSSTIDLATAPYDGTSGSSDITQAASQLAAQMFLSGVELEIKKETQIKSESFTYDPVADVLLSLRYQVFSVFVAGSKSDPNAGEITSIPGDWLTLEDIEVLGNEKLGPVLRTIKNAIKNLTQ